MLLLLVILTSTTSRWRQVIGKQVNTVIKAFDRDLIFESKLAVLSERIFITIITPNKTLDSVHVLCHFE